MKPQSRESFSWSRFWITWYQLIQVWNTMKSWSERLKGIWRNKKSSLWLTHNNWPDSFTSSPLLQVLTSWGIPSSTNSCLHWKRTLTNLKRKKSFSSSDPMKIWIHLSQLITVSSRRPLRQSPSWPSKTRTWYRFPSLWTTCLHSMTYLVADNWLRSNRLPWFNSWKRSWLRNLPHSILHLISLS